MIYFKFSERIGFPIRIPAMLLSHQNLYKHDSSCFIYANVDANFQDGKKLADLRLDGETLSDVKIEEGSSRFAYYLLMKYNHEIMILAENTVSYYLTAKVILEESGRIVYPDREYPDREIPFHIISPKDLAHAQYLLADLEYRARIDLTNRRVTWFCFAASFLSGVAAAAATIYSWKGLGFS